MLEHLAQLIVDPTPERDESHAITRYRCTEECPAIRELDRMANIREAGTLELQVGRNG